MVSDVRICFSTKEFLAKKEIRQQQRLVFHCVGPELMVGQSVVTAAVTCTLKSQGNNSVISAVPIVSTFNCFIDQSEAGAAQ